MNNHELHQRLIDDLNKVCVLLIEMYGLKYSKGDDKLSSPLIRWLDFVSRYIPCCKRQFLLSTELQSKIKNELPKEAIEQLRKFLRRSIDGSDLNPFQGKGLIQHNDTSNIKKQKRTDLLYADWGIHHFHLSSEIDPEEYFSVRSDWLLFSLVYDDVICCVDVSHHKDKNVFSRRKMLEIIYRNWPSILEPYNMGGIGRGKNWNDSEISGLRKAGVASCHSIDDKVFFPMGKGLTMAGIPLKNTFMEQNVMHGVSCIVNTIEDPQSKLNQTGYNSPEYEFSIYPEGLCLYDVNNDVAYTFNQAGNERHALNLMHSLITPSWVCQKIKEKIRTDDSLNST